MSRSVQTWTSIWEPQACGSVVGTTAPDWKDAGKAEAELPASEEDRSSSHKKKSRLIIFMRNSWCAAN
ncbi:hypothetical protein F2P81_015200 [Scophthalmus maximus]|uniref:Uncharacterized protein n=1 Tax=Scophthalmus maximus TaxID=52904 RepID=A0A6A4SLZ7_SCOMX|nr:hypothetical protein F2P81_015200 [Scophthalmus maximus]